ncbi:MAG: hypothetical protein RML56_14840 [Burkholderiales bacterium]|nr:hypothetical protein [Burkholderiales bacterium]
MPEKRREIARLIEGLPRPLVGLTWRAGTLPTKGRLGQFLFKAVPFEAFAQMAATLPGTLVVLQREPKAEEIARLRELCGERVADFSHLNPDLEAMHALLAEIDDYVGVSNTNMHLMAALGRTARVLVSRSLEFRWMAEGDESPWFPGFRIYRQKKGGGWSEPLSAAAADIWAAFASGRAMSS